MKHDIKIISYITIIIFILLWMNQLFSGINLYLSEKNQWQRQMDSVIERCIDYYTRPLDDLNPTKQYRALDFDPETYILRIWNHDTVYTIQVDRNETQQSIYMCGMYEIRTNKLHSLSQLDSLLKATSSTKSSFISRQIDSLGKEIDRFPHTNKDISRMLHSKTFPLGYVSGESLEIHYNFPITIFLTKAWNSILTLLILTLLLILLIFSVIYLYRFLRKLSRYQEATMEQVIHDWKTPLNSIGMATQLLQRKSIAPADEKGMEKINLILKETEHLKNSSQQLLRTLSGIVRIQIEKTEFDLKRELTSLIEEQQMAHSNKKEMLLTLHYQLSNTNIHASHFHLTCAIRNLLDNAIKYGNNTPKIFINCYLESSMLIIEVKDNGPGITKEKQKYIFNKYYQIDQKESSKKGYGLGLNYVYNVIKAHRGTITLDSTPGKGCTFIIRLRKWKKK